MRSMAGPPVRRNRQTRVAASARNTRFKQLCSSSSPFGEHHYVAPHWHDSECAEEDLHEIPGRGHRPGYEKTAHDVRPEGRPIHHEVVACGRVDRRSCGPRAGDEVPSWIIRQGPGGT